MEGTKCELTISDELKKLLGKVVIVTITETIYDRDNFYIPSGGRVDPYYIIYPTMEELKTFLSEVDKVFPVSVARAGLKEVADMPTRIPIPRVIELSVLTDGRSLGFDTMRVEDSRRLGAKAPMYIQLRVESVAHPPPTGESPEEVE